MDDEEVFLECPRCSTDVEESSHETLFFDCPMCGLKFDMTVCENCGQWVGVYGGDGDNCPKCGEKHTT